MKIPQHLFSSIALVAMAHFLLERCFQSQVLNILFQVAIIKRKNKNKEKIKKMINGKVILNILCKKRRNN